MLTSFVAASMLVAALTGSLAVTGDVATPLTLSATDLAAMPRTQVELQDGAKTVRYEGVLVADILAKAGVPVGKALHGKDLARAVVASATDGYRVAFSIGELDAQLTRSRVIVADRVDGQPLTEPQGPLRLIVPGDTRGARGVRMLVKLEVVGLAK